MKTETSPVLKGQNVLVTGELQELGLEIARALGEAGARIMLSGPDAGALETAVAELQASGVDARWTAADCQQTASLARLCRETLQRMGAIHILLNGGAGLPEPLEHDLRCYELPSREAAASMLAQGAGCIINLITLTSAQALSAPHPLAALTRSLAAQWAAGHVRVNTLCHQVATRAAAVSNGSLQALSRQCLELAAGAGASSTGQWRVVPEDLPQPTGKHS